MLLRLLMGVDKTTACTAYERHGAGGDAMARADGLVFVRDGFDAQVGLFAPVWLATQKAWLALAAYLAALIVIIGVIEVFDLSPIMSALAVAALHLVVGFEAADLRHQALERDGYRALGVTVGKDALDCERRFLDLWLVKSGVHAGDPGQTGGKSEAPGAFGLQAPFGVAAVQSRSFARSEATAQRPRVIGDLLGLGRGSSGAGPKGRP